MGIAFNERNFTSALCSITHVFDNYFIFYLAKNISFLAAL